MEVKYLVAIVAGSLFLLLFLVFVILSARRKKIDALQRQRLEQMYADKNLVKMEYDFVAYDEETEKLISELPLTNGQMSFHDIDPASVPSFDNAVFQSVDTDGIEEIVGNYKPE